MLITASRAGGAPLCGGFDMVITMLAVAAVLYAVVSTILMIVDANLPLI